MHECPDCKRECECDCDDDADDCTHFLMDACGGVQSRDDTELRIIGSDDYELGGEAGDA